LKERGIKVEDSLRGEAEHHNMLKINSLCVILNEKSVLGFKGGSTSGEVKDVDS
jgi:hypothetical protein